MGELKHGFRIDTEACQGRMHCMRACPTHAIRVKDGKARLISELCIDCGLCLTVCPTGAIAATTLSFADLDRFQFKVAVA
jgi:Fe-S-cluster-containing hydrogenase component 2